MSNASRKLRRAPRRPTPAQARSAVAARRSEAMAARDLERSTWWPKAPILILDDVISAPSAAPAPDSQMESCAACNGEGLARDEFGVLYDATGQGLAFSDCPVCLGNSVRVPA